jgi:glycerophosphoryl diester phosphodiesterase
MSGERAMATVLGQYLTESAEPLLETLKAVQRELQEAAVASGIDLSQPGASPLASLVVFDAYTRSLYNLGDCSYGMVFAEGFHPVYNERRVDQLAAHRRAEVLVDHLDRDGGVVAGDPGRAAIIGSLKEGCFLANANPLQFSPHDTLYGVPKSDLVYPVFDATSPPALSLLSIPKGTTDVVLSSDGYPRIFPTLHESEAYLERSLAVDPLRIAEHPSTKGIAPGAVSYDDRTYLRISI